MQTENQQSERLIDFVTVLNQQNDYEEILRVLAHKAARLLNAEMAIIMMINPRTRQTVRTIFKVGQKGDQGPYRKAHTQLSGWVIKNRQPFMSSNIKRDPRFTRKLFENLPIKSVLAVP